MLRTHLSKKPIEKIYETLEIENSFKPKGLWYEIDGDWRRWCESEQPDWIENYILYEIDLGNTNVLKIDNLAQLYEFDKEYKIDDWKINWQRLATEYDGIEIAPYQWEARLTFDWYYTWDCASGVIWRPKNARVINPSTCTRRESTSIYQQ